MIAGQIRTWPKISMISNRMRIEASIERARNSLRQQNKSSRNGSRTNSSRSNPELFKLTQHLENQDISLLDNNNLNNGNHSDSGSGDELIFLTRRRVSMPDGSFANMEEKDFFREQHRRRKFMAQFNDTSMNNISNNTSKASILFDSDSDSQIVVPSSPEEDLVF